MRHVIIEDASREFWQGAIVEQQVAEAIERRGGITLPINPDSISANAVSGYFTRSWGAGWPMSEAPVPLAPMIVFASTEPSEVHWAARVMPNDKRGGPLVGSLRLVADSSQRYGMSGGLSESEAAKIDCVSSGAQGGFILRGRGRFRVQQEGYYGFVLYGACSNARLVWSAMTHV